MESVLIVDDSKAMRMLVRRAVLAAGLGVETIREAPDGRAAFYLISESKPQLVLCDWNMAGGSGLQLLQALNAARLWVPFVFITSESSPGFHARAVQHGALGLITKPFTPTELGDAVTTLVRAAGMRN